MKWLVTRPAAQAVEWVARLAVHGIEAQALPLIRIDAAPEPARVADTWATLGTRALVVFVSPSAVEMFFAARPADLQKAPPWPEVTRAGSIGPGTTRALLRAGVRAERIVAPDDASQRFDAEALWQQRLAGDDWRGASVLFVRGDGGRDGLADHLRAAGAAVQAVAAYRRCAPRLDAAQRAVLDDALATPATHGWLFSSSEAIDHLDALAPGAAWAGACAIATHPRIGARARALGFGTVHEASAGFDAVVACIHSMR